MSPLLDSYLRDCVARISERWSYPRELAYDLQQDLVLLEVQVRHDGSVERVTVERSSGFEAFDDTAVRAVRLASPLAPPPPEELFRHGRNYVVLRLSMRYRNPMFE
jgi:TonB family protein